MQLPITQETMPPPDLKKANYYRKKDLDTFCPSENVIIKDNGTKLKFSMGEKRVQNFTGHCLPRLRKTVMNNSR